MSRSTLFSVSALVLVLSVPLASPALAQTKFTTPATLKADADALLARSFPADGPGAAAVVMRGGKIVYAAERGLADLGDKAPITPDTMFKLGSITKQFTAAIVLQLVDEGKLSLDDPLSRFFPDWPKPGAAATVRQLLNHTSGLQDYSKIPGWIASHRDRTSTTAELVALSKSLPSKAAPGEAWEYNNGGYVVLGAIIEKVTGKPWHSAVQERIARPLGLTSVAYAVDVAADPRMARGYSVSEGKAVPAPQTHMSVAGAAGGLVGSVGDLARWADALHHGRVVKPALYAEMTRPARLNDGSTEPYGFGLRLQRLRGMPAFVHGGSGAGLDTDSAYVPFQNVFVAVFANSDRPQTDPSLLTRRLAAIALGEPFPTFAKTVVPMAEIEPWFGAYKAEGAPPLRFFGRGDKLFLAHGERQTEMFTASGNRLFFGPKRLAWAELKTRADGTRMIEMNDPERAEPRLAVRTGPVPADTDVTVPVEVLKSYTGRFQTEVKAATVALKDGVLTLQPDGGPVWQLRPVSQTEFRLDDDRMRLVFNADGGFTLHRGARELHGKRIAP